MSDVTEELKDEVLENLAHISLLAENGTLSLEEVDYLLHARVIGPIRGVCMCDRKGGG